jgi:oxygen-independent coproporphyrinogen III oxidase
MNCNHPTPAGLYVHIPFCLRKCPYCDFYSITDLGVVPDFLAALDLEMQLIGRTAPAFDTVYIGGGTPSVLGLADIGRMIASAQTYFQVQADAEITLEINPGTVTLASLRQLRRCGVNRLNIGIQSFQDENLRFLQRIHSSRDGLSAVQSARRAGFANIGLDLMYALPGQKKSDWLKDLRRAVDIGPEHLSCYLLTREPGTTLEREISAGRVQMPTDQRVRELFDATVDFLTAHGYEHYEVSNFAALTADSSDPRISVHNCKYWSYAPYIGLGPSAHSFLEPVRCWNHRSVARYIRALKAGRSPVAGKEKLSRVQMMTEIIYLGLRTKAGIDLNVFRRKFKLDFQVKFKDTLAALDKEGMITMTASHCALSRKGLPLLDSIAVMFTDEPAPRTSYPVPRNP